MSTIPGNFTDGSLTASDAAAHSATLALALGDFKISGLVPDGRMVTVTDSRGVVVGARKAARARPTFAFGATLSSPSAPFQMLVLGETSGFVSSIVAIGDAVGVDLAFTATYGAETRSYSLAKCICTGIEVAEGDPSTITYSGEVLGAVSVTGPEGTFTLISGL